MASIILGAVGAQLGGMAGGMVGAAIGQGIGAYLGYQLDQKLVGSGIREGSSSDLGIGEIYGQRSSYGEMIPICYGRVRLAGNIIWAQKVKEHTKHHTHHVRVGKRRTTSHTHTSHHYTISMAIAICEGPIEAIEHIWVDQQPLRLDHPGLRVYLGTEEQMPDSLMEAVEGVGQVPAYRGLAYIVLEDFQLGESRHHVPHITFEVRRQAQHNTALEQKIHSMVIIPGSGEFVYDPVIQYQQKAMLSGRKWIPKGGCYPINHHVAERQANVLTALDDMKRTCPNIEWVAPVATWFGDHVDMARCTISPRVEYHGESTTSPDIWEVAGYQRDQVRCISYEQGRPRYGGTISDASLERFLSTCRKRGYRILFYPLIMMDMPRKPWRGRITGKAEDVDRFFDGPEGYARFIRHYAHLVKGKVDGFVIGSELCGMTPIRSPYGSFPVVQALIALAKEVRSILGESVIITYAADWSEYHHCEGGWYHLDPLWACDAIDVIGIDAYFPLTDLPQSHITEESIIKGWHSGEGYTWHGRDQDKQPLNAEFAWKNIAWWWENKHHNPDGKATAWIPKSKKIWFTEYGFASMDGCSNQPNIFYDPDSREGGIAKHSYGHSDIAAQRLALEATEKAWENSPFLERKFLWCWDARPYPAWPDFGHIWADAPLWSRGHWVNGKLGMSALGGVVLSLCHRVGMRSSEVDVSRLHGVVEGLVITHQQSVRTMLELLQVSYGFHTVEREGYLVMRPEPTEISVTLNCDDCLDPMRQGDHQEGWELHYQNSMVIPTQLDISYFNKQDELQPGLVSARRVATYHQHKQRMILPLVLSESHAKEIAERALHRLWMGQIHYQLTLPPGAEKLYVGDILAVQKESKKHLMRILQLSLTPNGAREILAVNTDSFSSSRKHIPDTYYPNRKLLAEMVPKIKCHFFELPAIPWEQSTKQPLLCGAILLEGGKWKGGAICMVSPEMGGDNILPISHAATFGSVIGRLEKAKYPVIQEVEFEVVLQHGLLSPAIDAQKMDTWPYALIGKEVVQFREAALLEEHHYRLKGILRGCLGTEHHMAHMEGEKFILLDPQTIRIVELPHAAIKRSYPFEIYDHQGELLETAEHQVSGESLRPWPPCHIALKKERGRYHVTWVRRSRAMHLWQDEVDAPLSEELESYDVVIQQDGKCIFEAYDLRNPQLVLPKNIGGDRVQITIWQRSCVVGRGREATITCNKI